MNQNLSSYKIFYTVANTGNISKAAKELYISQPAISKSIQKLEESIGARLFERSSRGVTLTDAGELLYTHVKSAFETLTLGEDKLRRSIELGVGHLTIGVSSTLCKYVLLPYLKEFIKQYKELKEKHPDAIYVFRKDNWTYEIYFNDAEITSKICGFTLGKIENTKIPLLSFCEDKLDLCLTKLVRFGKRVAILEPLKEPSKVTELVKNYNSKRYGTNE